MAVNELINTTSTKILITGASGYIGNKLAHLLAENGCEVHALLRSDSAKHLLQHQQIKIFYGNLLDFQSIYNAMQGCSQVYHTAGLVKLWANNSDEFYQSNVTGTQNVLDAALQAGVKKMVYTSSCGVWSASINGPLTENDPRTFAFDNDYDLSKYLAEKLVKEYSKKGLDAVIVNPPRIYGPGVYRYSNGVNRFLKHILLSKIAFVPANLKSENNYSFIDDVVRGHILAMEKGKSGERYILGGENASYGRIIELIRKYEKPKSLIISLPISVIKIFSWIELFRCRLTRHEPLLIPSAVSRLSLQKAFDCSKAINDLGYSITPLEEGLRITLNFLNKSYANPK